MEKITIKRIDVSYLKFVSPKNTLDIVPLKCTQKFRGLGSFHSNQASKPPWCPTLLIPIIPEFEVLIRDGTADFKGVMMAFMGIFYAGMGAGQAAVIMGDTAKAKA